MHHPCLPASLRGADTAPGRQGQLWALQGAGGATGSRLGRSPGARGLRTHLGLISRQLGDHPSSAHSDGGHTAWGGGERRCPVRQTGRRTPCRKQAGRAHTPGRPSQAGHPASVPFNPPNTLKAGTTSTRPVSRMRKLRPKERSHSPTTAQLRPEHIRAHVLVAFQARAQTPVHAPAPAGWGATAPLPPPRPHSWVRVGPRPHQVPQLHPTPRMLAPRPTG